MTFDYWPTPDLHTYGQCKYCTEFHATYPQRPVTSPAVMWSALGAIVALHHKQKEGFSCCEGCDTDWPCSTYEIAARALGFEVPDETP